MPASRPSNPDQPPDSRHDPTEPVLVSADLRLAAAARLVGEHADDPLEAGQRFLASAAALKIDVSAMFAVLGPSRVDVLEVALGIVGAGRTAMVFVSGPPRRSLAWLAPQAARTPTSGADHDRRVACLHRLCDHLAALGPESVVLAQALLEPEQRASAAAMRSAGFLQLGDLAYMRRPLTPSVAVAADHPDLGTWGDRLSVESVAQFTLSVGGPVVQRMLMEALDLSYVDTRDCPELCGLRAVSDVVRSHQSVGAYDPRFWWIVRMGDRGVGCMLLSPCPEQDSVELVYMGIGPELRGNGLGGRLLSWAIEQVRFRVLGEYRPTPDFTGSGGITCAVDTRNPAAVRLYRRLGFQRFANRVPLVRRVCVQEAQRLSTDRPHPA